MPSVYTHYLFANAAIDRLPEKLRTTVCLNRKYYDLGQSGADLMFYYKPHKGNAIRTRGSQIHRVKANELFKSFLQIANSSLTPERDVAYITGFFTHFILDSAMHPYIWKCDEGKIAPHFVIEADYDRKLLIDAGENPYNAKFLEYQTIDKDTEEIAAKYLKCTPAQVHKMLKSRKKFTKLISSQNPFVRGLLKFLFKISSNPKGNDILIQKDENPACRQIRKDLKTIFDRALCEIETYGKEFEDFLLYGGPLGARFDRDFE